VERKGSRPLSRVLLNDLVLSTRFPARMIDVAVSIDGGRVMEFPGDGIVVATPLGSTAYSLSAGGPIVHPALEAFVVTPICPHTLWARPLLAPASQEIEIRLERQTEGLVHGDGFVLAPLRPGDRVVVRRSKSDARLVQLGTRSPYERLRVKLHWGSAKGLDAPRAG
jgi:NAD+ kinase